MAALGYGFFVDESEYLALQEACPGDFPWTYPEFEKRANDFVAANRSNGVETKLVRVKVTDFLRWCDKAGRSPDNGARSLYAVEVGNRRESN